jgi:hypothetical protein
LVLTGAARRERSIQVGQCGNQIGGKVSAPRARRDAQRRCARFCLKMKQKFRFFSQ